MKCGLVDKTKIGAPFGSRWEPWSVALSTLDTIQDTG